MTALRRGDYRDPLTILIERESRTCKGCIHSAVAFDRRYCTKGKKHGKRCKQYTEGEIMRRVRKEEVQRPEPKEDGLSICLDCWKLWMSRDDRDLGASRMRLHAVREEDRESAVGYERDVYEEQRIADIRIGEATGAMIESLKPAHRWAIYKQCGITTQWRFDRLQWEPVAIEALADLEQKLRRNFETARLF